MLTPQTVSVIVANLERMETITRVPHAVHGRVLQIEVTSMGKRSADAVQVIGRGD